VFGIATDFKRWNICWFPDSSAAAEADNLFFYEGSSGSPLVEDDLQTRKLVVSETYHSNDSRKLALSLVSLFKKLDHLKSYKVHVPLLSRNRNYVALMEGTWYWKKGPDIKELSLIMPDIDVSHYMMYLLVNFESGSFGRGWLAYDDKGCLMVVKFLTSSKEEQILRELNAWKTLGFTTVKRIMVDDFHVLALPLAFVYKTSTSLDNWWETRGIDTSIILNFDSIISEVISHDPVEVLRRCIDRCAECQIVHGDIKWQHIGIFPCPPVNGISPFQYSFIDLGLTEHNTMKSVNECKELMNVEATKILQESG
jgi:hypothetical protein